MTLKIVHFDTEPSSLPTQRHRREHVYGFQQQLLLRPGIRPFESCIRPRRLPQHHPGHRLPLRRYGIGSTSARPYQRFYCSHEVVTGAVRCYIQAFKPKSATDAYMKLHISDIYRTYDVADSCIAYFGTGVIAYFFNCSGNYIMAYGNTTAEVHEYNCVTRQIEISPYSYNHLIDRPDSSTKTWLDLSSVTNSSISKYQLINYNATKPLYIQSEPSATSKNSASSTSNNSAPTNPTAPITT